MNCVADFETDLAAFKKIVANGKDGENRSDLSLEMRNLWINRMKDKSEELRVAARSWAGLTDGTLKLEEINPFWNGIDPPSLISLPHIAAQALLGEVHISTCFQC
jgi:hypothetical protein